MYITFRRRKWKESGSSESNTNTYHFHKEGMKTTEEFGFFFILIYERYPLGEKDLLEKNTLSFSVLSQVFNICNKKIFRWYKDVLSGFMTEEIQKEIREFDTVDSSIINPYTQKPEMVLTPICKPETDAVCISHVINIGSQLWEKYVHR